MEFGGVADNADVAFFSMAWSRLRDCWLVLVPVVVVAVTVLVTSSIQKSAEQRAFDRIQNSQRLLSAWLDRSNDLRVFLQTGKASAFDAFNRLTVTFQAALQTERADVRGVAGTQPTLALEVQSAQRWHSLGLIAAADIRLNGVRPQPIAITKPRSDASAAFLAANQRFTAVMAARRRHDIEWASEVGNVIVVLAVLILAIVALAVTRASRGRDKRLMEDRLRDEQARAAREHDYVESRRRLSQVMMAADTEDEACELTKTAIESRVPGSSVVVLRANNSADRLEPVTSVAEALAPALDGATPRSCLAVRLGRPQTGDPSESSLALCQVCGQTNAYATCEPLVVGGEVMGSVLITHPQQLGNAERRVVDDTIAVGAPVLANLRNLALAERRALTDSLTGLPNRRALDDMLKLMLAQAMRTDAPLAIVLVDVDGFKEANDTFGHDRGDELLSTVARSLARSVRASDFVARLGGDEFVALLPATDLDGARTVTEKLAAATREARLAGLNCAVTASFGIAGFPEHGTDIDAVMRGADSALYQAKNDGRDCVRLAPAAQPAASGAK
jgi:diguanylate cyclase (GGDEF)-like protein